MCRLGGRAGSVTSTTHSIGTGILGVLCMQLCCQSGGGVVEGRRQRVDWAVWEVGRVCQMHHTHAPVANKREGVHNCVNPRTLSCPQTVQLLLWRAAKWATAPVGAAAQVCFVFLHVCGHGRERSMPFMGSGLDSAAAVGCTALPVPASNASCALRVRLCVVPPLPVGTVPLGLLSTAVLQAHRDPASCASSGPACTRGWR